MLTPFETYDLLFVRDTINNLNYDNEILNDSISDLKTAFIFLLEKHKELKRSYEKERQANQLAGNYKTRVNTLEKELELQN